MWILFDILLILLFSIFFIAIIFIVKGIKTTTWFLNLRITSSTKVATEGIIYGLFIFLSTYILNSIYFNNIAYWLIGFFIFISLKESINAIFSASPSAIIYFVKQEVNIDTYIMYGLIFGMSLLFLITNFFLNKKKLTRIIIYSIFIIASSVAYTLILNKNTLVNEQELLESFIFTIIGTMISEIVISWIIQISLSANILYDSINYTFSNYFRSQVKNKFIGEAIKKDKIKKALYIIFDINVNSFREKEIEEVKETILLELESLLPKPNILFQSEKNLYGAFIPIYFNVDFKKTINNNYKNDKDDQFNFLRTITKLLSTKYKLKNSKIISARVSAGLSIYGIQNESLNLLEKDAIFALSYIPEDKSDVNIFDPEEYRIRKIETNLLHELDDVIKLDSLVLRFKALYSKERINIVEFILAHEDEFISTIKDFLKMHNLYNVYDRYLAATAIKYSPTFNGKMAIPYPIKELKEINIDKFILRLKLMHIKPSRIILVLRSKNIKEDKKLLEKINSLRKNKIKFAFKDLNKDKENIINYYKPEYLFYEKLGHVYKDQNNAFIAVTTEKDLLKAYNLGIKQFAGNLISSKTKPHFLQKQSKIYIEEIIERGKNG